MIERDNCFPNVAYILRSNMHRFERFSNEGSPRREKYLKLRAKEGEERLARAWVINGIDHAPMARSNGGRRVSRVRKRERGKNFWKSSGSRTKDRHMFLERAGGEGITRKNIAFEVKDDGDRSVALGRPRK